MANAETVVADFVGRLRSQRILPVLRGEDPDRIADIVDVLVGAGLDTVELTMSSSDPEGDLHRARARHPGAVLGIGTVTRAKQVAPVHEAGADFVVTPVANPEVVEACAERSLPIVPGAFTPTEVLAMHSLGAAAVKVFPAGRLGPAYLSDLRAVTPEVALVPTGGIDEWQVGEYLERGAVAVGLGSSLTGAALRGEPGAREALLARVQELVRRLATL